jgi:hypothetical protein
MKKWGVEITDPAITFKQIDKDKVGTISFAEFAQWAISTSFDLDDDDNFLMLYTL